MNHSRGRKMDVGVARALSFLPHSTSAFETGALGVRWWTMSLKFKIVYNLSGASVSWWRLFSRFLFNNIVSAWVRRWNMLGWCCETFKDWVIMTRHYLDGTISGWLCQRTECLHSIGSKALRKRRKKTTTVVIGRLCKFCNFPRTLNIENAASHVKLANIYVCFIRRLSKYRWKFVIVLRRSEAIMDFFWRVKTRQNLWNIWFQIFNVQQCKKTILLSL